VGVEKEGQIKGTLVISNKVDSFRRFLDGAQEPVHWLVVGYGEASQRAAAYLRSRKEVKELDSGELFRQRREKFRSRYIQFMAALNRQNGSLKWWGLPPSSKEPNAGNLYWDLAAFLLIVDVVRDGYRQLLVVADSAQLVAQVKAWAKEEGISAVGSLKQPNRWQSWLKWYTPAPAAKAFLSTSGRWLLSRRCANRCTSRETHVVLVSLSYPSSFEGGRYRDAYFGPLVDYLEKSNVKALVAALVRGPFLPQLSKIKNLDREVPVIPIEGFLTFFDLLRSLGYGLWRFAAGIKIKGNLQIEGVDVGILVRRSFTEACRSASPFMYFWFYRAGIRIGQATPVDRLIYPYENRSWEKMLVLGARRSCPHIRLVGYQHAAITASHLHFFFGPEEAAVTPLPDVVLTTGPFVRDWLEKEGGYPAGVLAEGCGLRNIAPEMTNTKTPSARRPERLLVALGHPQLEDYAKTLMILREAMQRDSGWDVVIRPHPRNPQSAAEAIRASVFAGTSLPPLSTGPLKEEMERAGVVVYSSSTVGLEAASLGIPTICLDPGKALDMDPMWGWNAFKWHVVDVKGFCEAIGQIRALPSEKLEEGRRQARAFGRSYLSPVTEVGLRQFLKA
jgi:surface carbohydrate biosynthesis protein (TIGR04326 family)